MIKTLILVDFYSVFVTRLVLRFSVSLYFFLLVYVYSLFCCIYILIFTVKLMRVYSYHEIQLKSILKRCNTCVETKHKNEIHKEKSARKVDRAKNTLKLMDFYTHYIYRHIRIFLAQEFLGHVRPDMPHCFGPRPAQNQTLISRYFIDGCSTSEYRMKDPTNPQRIL